MLFLRPIYLEDEEILAAPGKLPLNYRTVILLTDSRRVFLQEAAMVLNIPIGTVMSRLSHARKQMREHISHYEQTYSINKTQATTAGNFSSFGNTRLAMVN